MAAGAGDAVIDFECPSRRRRRSRRSPGAWATSRSASSASGPPTTSATAASTTPTTDWPLDARAGWSCSTATTTRGSTASRALDADGLARPCGPAEGPFAEYPMAALVLHINREALHHGAEIALLLDLYTAPTGGPR